MTHICVDNLTNFGSDKGLSPGRRQAIILTNAGISLIGPLGTNFSEILIGIQTFSFTKMHLKMSSAKWRPFCLGLNELTAWCVGDFPSIIISLTTKPQFILCIRCFSQVWSIHFVSNTSWYLAKITVSLMQCCLICVWLEFKSKLHLFEGFWITYPISLLSVYYYATHLMNLTMSRTHYEYMSHM